MLNAEEKMWQIKSAVASLLDSFGVAIRVCDLQYSLYTFVSAGVDSALRPASHVLAEKATLTDAERTVRIRFHLLYLVSRISCLLFIVFPNVPSMFPECIVDVS